MSALTANKSDTRIEITRPTHTIFLLADTTVCLLENLPDLDLGFGSRHRIRAALDPFDRLLLRLHLPQPEAGDQLLRLGEWPVGHRALVSREFDARALRARMEPLTREHHARLHKLFVVLPHLGQELLVRKN